MPKKRLQVRDLSNEAGLDIDEVLLRLWAEQIDYVSGPSDWIEKRDLQKAREATGIPTRRDVRSNEYWQGTLRISQDELSRLYEEWGFSKALRKTPPRGAIRKLRAEVLRRQLDSLPRAPKPAVARRKESPPFIWTQIGRECPLQMLSFQDVVDIHNTLVQDFDGDSDPINPAGVRNENILHSAVSRPHTQIGSERKYRTVEMAAAALLHSLVMDHPFHNGNKRTGLVALLVFLDKNGFLLTCIQEELFKLVLRVAQHSIVDRTLDDLSDREVIEIAQWVKSNSRLVVKGETPIPFRTLRRILTMYNCRIDTAGPCVNIKRTTYTNAGFFGKPRHRELLTQVAYYGEGREVPINSIAKIRAELELDDEHNVDSKSFYQGELQSADDFIANYRMTLRRLAKL